MWTARRHRYKTRLEAFLLSFFVVATAGMGDKTQLLAFSLASRFRKPIPIILRILAATLTNHFATGLVGQWLGSVLSGNLLHWLLALSFFAAAMLGKYRSRSCEPCQAYCLPSLASTK